MSAGRPEETSSEPPSNSPSSVNKFADALNALEGAPLPVDGATPDDITFLDAFAGLPDIRQTALLKRAQAVLKLDEIPTLDDARIGVNPPQEPPKRPKQPTRRSDPWKRDPADRGELPPGWLETVARAEETAQTRFRERLEAWRADVEAWKLSVATYRTDMERHERFRGLAGWLHTFFLNAEEYWPGAVKSTWSEDKMRALAKDRAEEAENAIVLRRIAEFVPAGTPLSPDDLRAMCPTHQLRLLRREVADASQFWSAACMTIGASACCYADDFTLGRFRWKRAVAREFGESRILIGEDGLPLLDRNGVPVSMAAIQDAHRRAACWRIYTQSKGQEDVATRMGLQAYFLTLTLPSRFHPNPVYRDHRTWTPQYSPRVADREIKRRWRAFCRNVQKAKRGIPLLGIKMIEGHKDGCPHVHAILYLPEGKSDEVDAILQRYFPEPVEGQRVATKFVHIDPAAGATPTTYLMKYLLKTVNVSPEEALRDGVPELAGTATVNNPEIAIEEHEKEDENGDTANESEQGAHLENFERHLALANERRWRRYSTLGTHGMQRLWQRLYNLRQPPENAPEHAQEAWNAMFDAFPENFRAAWLAMQDRDWGTVVIELGALQQKVLDHADGRIPARPRVRLEYVTEETTPEGETRPLLNQYGETIKRAEFIAVEGDAWRLPVRAKKWTIGKLSDLKQPVADGADSGETEKVSENRGVAYGDSYPSSPPAVVSKCVDPTDPALEYGRKMVAQTRHKADANLRKLVGDRWGWPDWEEWIARTVQIYPDLADVIA